MSKELLGLIIAIACFLAISGLIIFMNEIRMKEDNNDETPK